MKKQIYMVEFKENANWTICCFDWKYDYSHKMAVEFRNELQESFPDTEYRVVKFTRAEQ